MNADLDTGDGAPVVGGAPGGGGGGGGGAPGGGAPVAPAAAPVLNLPTLTIPVNGNTAAVPIQCLIVDCTGILTLQNAQQAGLARVATRQARRPKSKRPKVVSYGSASFSLKAGTTGKIKVKLNGAGRKLLKRHRSVKVWAYTRFSSGGGAPKSARLTLKR